jgi:hypothetical protein
MQQFDPALWKPVVESGNGLAAETLTKAAALRGIFSANPVALEVAKHPGPVDELIAVLKQVHADFPGSVPDPKVVTRTSIVHWALGLVASQNE